MDGVTWEQFVKDINVIYEISKELKDGWELIHVNEDIGGKYLVKSCLIPVADHDGSKLNELDDTECLFEEEFELSVESTSDGSLSKCDRNQRVIKFEYHVLYHLSYAVPYLCFNAHDSSGSMLTFDDAWRIFNDPDYLAVNKNNLKMTNILTQMDHPILFKPFLTLHPCRIAEILNSLPQSQNKVLSFLSTYGPSIYLTFDLRYASRFENQK